MDDGVGSHPDASLRETEPERLAEQVALATRRGIGFWDWDVGTTYLLLAKRRSD